MSTYERMKWIMEKERASQPQSAVLELDTAARDAATRFTEGDGASIETTATPVKSDK